MDISICSHTIVKNGKPFIEPVLRQVIPYVDRTIITVSEKSDDGTLSIVRQLEKENPGKVRVLFENVKTPGELTQVRQDQLNRTYEDIVWFLDDDDYWPNEKIEAMLKIIEEDFDNPNIHAWTMCPYQLVNSEEYDLGWLGKFFTKFFKFDQSVHYRHPWPRDLIYRGDEVLYWKKNPKVKRVPVRFFHLSYLKDGSFRTEEWAKKFSHKIGLKEPIPPEERGNIFSIFENLNKL